MMEGRVPRQRWARGRGWDFMARRVERRVVEWACWRRVFRRSAGWRRKAERVPVERPARKWNAGRETELVGMGKVDWRGEWGLQAEERFEVPSGISYRGSNREGSGRVL